MPPDPDELAVVGEDGDEAEPDAVPDAAPDAEPDAEPVGVPGGLSAEITSSRYFLGSGWSFRITFHSPLAAGDHSSRFGSGGYSSNGTVMNEMSSRLVLRNCHARLTSLLSELRPGSVVIEAV